MYEIIFNRRLIYGPDSLEQTGNVSRKYGTNALIVTGRNSTKKSGSLKKLQKSLEENNIKYAVFDEVISNPTVEVVDECTKTGKENKCDFIIGLGGGSAIDTAKASSAMMTNEGSVEEYLEIVETPEKIVNNPLCIIAIPTTAGTGSEVTKNAVINAPERKMKRSMRNEKLVPEIAILDPVLLSTAPENIIASSAMDALTQLIEPFTGKKSHPVIDMIVLDGIRRIKKNLLEFINDTSNLEAGLNLLIASYFSGISLANAGLGTVHALSRPFGGIYNLSHGLTCAILLPYITEYNWKYNVKKYAQIGIALGGDKNLTEERSAANSVEIIFKLNKTLEIPENFKKFNLPKEDIDKIIEDSQGGSMRNNPKDFTKQELKEFLLKIL